MSKRLLPYFIIPSILLTGVYSIIPKIFSEAIILQSISSPAEISKCGLVERFHRIKTLFLSNIPIHLRFFQEKMNLFFDINLTKKLIRSAQANNFPYDQLLKQLNILVLQQLVLITTFPPLLYIHLFSVYSILNYKQYVSDLKASFGLADPSVQPESFVPLLSMINDHLMNISLESLSSHISSSSFISNRYLKSSSWESDIIENFETFSTFLQDSLHSVDLFIEDHFTQFILNQQKSSAELELLFNE